MAGNDPFTTVNEAYGMHSLPVSMNQKVTSTETVYETVHSN